MSRTKPNTIFRKLRDGDKFRFPWGCEPLIKLDHQNYRCAHSGRRGTGRPWRQDDLDAIVIPL